MSLECELARFVRGEIPLRSAKHIRVRDLPTVEQKWIFSIVWAWKTLGVFAPKDDQILIRRIHEMHLSEEDLEHRVFLEETTEERMAAELKRLRGLSS